MWVLVRACMFVHVFCPHVIIILVNLTNPAICELAEGPWAIAIYDYEATCEDELSFCEGQRIQLMSKDENGVDDGFWQGEINGRIGVFPSLVVIEEVGLDDLDLGKVGRSSKVYCLSIKLSNKPSAAGRRQVVTKSLHITHIYCQLYSTES